jgi:selenocysteine lyase/cysteine desulfurase
MNTLKEVFYRHFELGYTRQLFWVDSLFLLTILFDFYVYHFYFGLPLNAQLIWTPGWMDLERSYLDILQFVLFLIVIVPIFITFLRVLGWGGTFLKGRLAKSQQRIFLIHLVICAVFVYLFLIALNMQRLSGWQQNGDGTYRYSLNSLFASLVSSHELRVLFTSANTIIGLLASAVISYVVLGKRTGNALTQYLIRASLADLPTPFRPAHSSHRFDVPNPSTLTRVQFVIEYANRVLREYQGLGPGSTKSIDYLDYRYSECIGTITDKLLRTPSAGSSSEPINITLFTGTKAAFQAALARIVGPKAIIMTPYASPALIKFIAWHCELTGDLMKAVSFCPPDYEERWQRQQQEFIARLGDVQSDVGKRELVFIVSEVFYASGQRLPLKSFIQFLKNTYANTKIHMLVDGTNAVGNRRIIALDPEWESYVFSPHKWLLTSESCGMLLSRSSSISASPSGWHVGERKTDAMIKIVAGLRGSVELMSSPGIEYFTSRCEKLRQQLKLNLPHTVRIVGDQSGLDESYIFSCVPSVRNAWKFRAAELEDQLVERRLNGSLVVLDEINPWVRFTIPYYLDVREITRFCDFLDEVVG